MKKIGQNLTSYLFIFVNFELVDIFSVLQPHVHPNERLPALETEQMPGFGLGQQFTDGTLGQSQDSFAERLLPDVVELKHLFHSGSYKIK